MEQGELPPDRGGGLPDQAGLPAASVKKLDQIVQVGWTSVSLGGQWANVDAVARTSTPKSLLSSSLRVCK